MVVHITALSYNVNSRPAYARENSVLGKKRKGQERRGEEKKEQ
jgi:hypothetical protein